MALLEVENLHAGYGRIEALHGISVTIEERALSALVGANGAGKTTLLRAISGLRPATRGTIRFADRDITRLQPSARVRLGIAQVPEGRQVFPGLSVEDNLAMGGYTRNFRDVAEGRERAFALFPMLKERRASAAGTLSGGQQQMLAIARALMSKPRLLLLDEPSMGLSPLLVAEVFRVIADLKASGVTIFLVEQNAQAALRIADRAYVIETGRTVLEGSGGALMADERVKSAYLGL